ncbi:MAG: thiamine phosphate synthase, partial [Oscillospiraceae bacterium]
MNFDITLYLVTDSTYHTETTFLKTIEDACKSGVTLLQLREKNKSGLELFNLAQKVKNITDKYNIPLIIDDRVDIALAVDAAGVHVGSSDIPIKYVRKILGKDKIVGATAKTVEAAKNAYDDGADYLGVGAIY